MLTSHRGMLRKLFSQHVNCVKRVNFDRFHEEQYRVRRDFDKIFRNPAATQLQIDTMIEKYEIYIQDAFEPYAAMHESRMHSNLWGKMVLWHDDCLATDHIGFYSQNQLLNPTPRSAHFHEEYPHHIQGWMYDDHYINAEFDYTNLERTPQQEQETQASDPVALKRALDSSHKM